MNYTFHFPHIVKQMDALDAPAPIGPWLDASYRQAENFWHEFGNYLGANCAPPYKSRAGEYYDLYHDLVLRHLGLDLPAWRWYEEDGWHTLSFDELHLLVAQCEAVWRQSGVEAGQCVCLVLPLGVDYVVSLLTAFKMGVVVSLLPPQGEQFLAKRLKSLKADHIVTSFLYRSLLAGFDKLILPEPGDSQTAYYAFATHTYVSQTVCAALFSPLSRNPHLARLVTCDDIYLPALRDSMLLFQLRPGNHLAAPGLHPLQYQPGLLLATLLAGAAYVHLGVEQIAGAPDLLQHFPLQVIGIGGELRDTLLSVSTSKISSWQLWFKNVAEPPAWSKWEQLVERLGIADVPYRNILYHAASGGSLLFSPKTKKTANLEVLPAPGLVWQLNDVNDSGQPARAGFGLLSTSLTETDKSPLGAILITRYQQAWLYAGTKDPRRDGRYMPRAEILAALADLDFTCQVDLLSVAGGNEGKTSQHILLVFVGARSDEQIAQLTGEWTVAIHACIAHALGAEFLPDRIEFYPLYAKQQGQAVDHRWCELQYLTGLLYRKSRHPVYQRLTTLRSLAISEPGGQKI